MDSKNKISRYFFKIPKSEQQLEWWYSCCVEYLKEKNMIETPDCSYARFIRAKLPQVWEKYVVMVIASLKGWNDPPC